LIELLNEFSFGNNFEEVMVNLFAQDLGEFLNVFVEIEQ
jgi:hypothetical protein